MKIRYVFSMLGLTLLIALTACKPVDTVTSFFKKGDVAIIPPANLVIHEATPAIGEHFREVKSEFVLNTTELKIYPEPDESKKSIDTLPLATRFKVVHKKDGWLFILTEMNNVLGWVKDSKIAYADRFKKIDRWDYDDIAFSKNEYFAQYQMLPNGSFINRWKSSGGGIVAQGVRKGHILEYNGLLYAKQERDYVNKCFLVEDKDESEIRHEYKYQNAPIILEPLH